jgi:hypothetical protein
MIPPNKPSFTESELRILESVMFREFKEINDRKYVDGHNRLTILDGYLEALIKIRSKVLTLKTIEANAPRGFVN